MTFMRALLLAGWLGTAVSSAEEPARYPDEATVRLIESQMVMPECAAPMEAYDRYYFFPKPGVFSRPVVEGAFRKRMPWHRTPGDAMATSSIPGAYVTTSEGAPHMNDGGCAFVTVVFDLTERKLIKLKREGDEQAQYGLCNMTVAGPIRPGAPGCGR